MNKNPTIRETDKVWKNEAELLASFDTEEYIAAHEFEFVRCKCEDCKDNAIRINEHTFIRESVFGYLCFNTMESEVFYPELLRVEITKSTIKRIETGTDVFLRIGPVGYDGISIIDEVEVCGRAKVNDCKIGTMQIERNGIVRIFPDAKIDCLDVRGTAIIGTEKVNKIRLRPGGKVRFCLHDETYYNIVCSEGREPFKADDNYICG